MTETKTTSCDFASVVSTFVASLSPQSATSANAYLLLQSSIAMLRVAPGCRRAVLEHLASTLLNNRCDCSSLTCDRIDELVALAESQLDLAEWASVLGEWSAQVLARSRYESPLTDFVERLLVACFSTAPTSTRNDWLQPVLLAGFSSRSLFSRILRRLVSSFSLRFVDGLIKHVLTTFQPSSTRQSNATAVYAVGQALDHLGHGFPFELQNVVDEMLSSSPSWHDSTKPSQQVLTLLLEVAETYPMVLSVVHLRLTQRLLLCGSDMRHLTQQLLSSAGATATSRQSMESQSKLQRCLLMKTQEQPTAWLRLMLAAVVVLTDNNQETSYAFAFAFVEHLLESDHRLQRELLAGVLTTSDAEMVLRRTLDSSSSSSNSTKPLVQLAATCLMTVPRPGSLLARVLLSFASSSAANSNCHFYAVFYAIAMTVAVRLGSGDSQHQLVETLICQAQEGNRQSSLVCGHLKRLLDLETHHSHQLSLFDDAAAPSWLSLRYHCSLYWPQLIVAILESARPSSKQSLDVALNIGCHYKELPQSVNSGEWQGLLKAGVTTALAIASECCRSTDSMPTDKLASSRIKVEKLVYILMLVISKADVDTPMLILDVFIRHCLANCVGTNPGALQRSIFVLTLKTLVKNPPQPSELAPFKPGQVWRSSTSSNTNARQLQQAARIVVSTLSPDITHNVSLAQLPEWPFDIDFSTGDYDSRLPVDVREFCLKLRTATSNHGPFGLDAIGLVLALASASSLSTGENAKILAVVLPLLRGLMVGAVLSLAATSKASNSLNTTTAEFVLATLNLVQLSRVSAPPLCHMSSAARRVEPGQLASMLRCAWLRLIDTTALHQQLLEQQQHDESSPSSPVDIASPSSPCANGTTADPVLASCTEVTAAILKSDIGSYSDLVPLFDLASVHRDTQHPPLLLHETPTIIA